MKDSAAVLRDPRPASLGGGQRARRLPEALEQAIAGDRFGWHAFWTVEHHFLQEYSHCSNPEVLYQGHRRPDRTDPPRLRRAPHAQALQPPGADRGVGGGPRPALGRAGRPRHRPVPTTRAELEGFGVDPAESRRMWQEAIKHVVGCWTNEEYEFSGEFWQMPRRRVQPKPWQKPHPPLWGATTSDEGHAQVGDLGLGLCSFAVGLPPSEVKRKIDIYRAAVAECDAPLGAFVHDQAATFTMAMCTPDRDAAIAKARESFEWYPQQVLPPDRHADGLDGGAQRGAGVIFVCGGHEEDRRRGHARSPQPGVPHGCQRLCARHARRMRGGLSSI